MMKVKYHSVLVDMFNPTTIALSPKKPNKHFFLFELFFGCVSIKTKLTHIMMEILPITPVKLHYILDLIARIA